MPNNVRNTGILYSIRSYEPLNCEFKLYVTNYKRTAKTIEVRLYWSIENVA